MACILQPQLLQAEDEGAASERAAVQDAIT
jgi:hypothetical protein